MPDKPDLKARIRRKQLEREGAVQHNVAKTSKREIRRAKMLVRFILDWYVDAGEVMDNDTWYHFRLAAQAASGMSLEVFDLISSHPYWRHDEWAVEPERQRWITEEPHSVTVGTLYAMARELGWGTRNAAEIQPDYVITSLSELPVDSSYLLRAVTGTGKSEAQRATIARVLEAGLKVCWLVPTKSLARAAATSFSDLGATVYLDENGAIRAASELLADRFIVTTPQTFARRIAKHGLNGYGLIVVDEVQQIADAAFDETNDLWDDKELNKAFRAAIEQVKAQSGLILRGLDAGLARGAQEWLGLPVYDCTATREKAPVIVHSELSETLEVLCYALDQEGLVYITSDTKKGAYQIARAIERRYPHKRMLVITADKVDTRKKECDRRALAFLNDPNAEVGAYDVIIVSPTMLTGVSITARQADYVVQFCTYLPPKSNLQMLNRFRRQGQVYVYYGGMGVQGDVRTPEEASAQAEALSSILAVVKRSKIALDYERIRAWSELDTLYQSLDPRAYYVHLLEREGRYVELGEDSNASYSLDDLDDETRAEVEANRQWALENYPHVEPYDPHRTYKGVEARVLEAMRLKRDVIRKTENGWELSPDKRLTALAAQQFKNNRLGIIEVGMGARERSTHNDRLVLDPDTPPSFIRKDDAILLLLHGLRILDYRGEGSISASVFIERGEALITFLNDNARHWNAVFSTPLVLTGDTAKDARAATKKLLSLVDLEMRRGRRVSVAGTRSYDADILNIAELKHLLYLRACGRALKDKQPLPESIEVYFPELARAARVSAELEAAEWAFAQPKDVQRMVIAELQHSSGLPAACTAVQQFLNGDVF